MLRTNTTLKTVSIDYNLVGRFPGYGMRFGADSDDG